MKEPCPKYCRRNNHLYLKAACRTIKKGVVEFAGYRWRARHDAASLEGLRVYVVYDSGYLVAWCGTKWISFTRCRATLKTSNIPIWDFNTWVPTLKPREKLLKRANSK